MICHARVEKAGRGGELRRERLSEPWRVPVHDQHLALDRVVRDASGKSPLNLATPPSHPQGLDKATPPWIHRHDCTSSSASDELISKPRDEEGVQISCKSTEPVNPKY